MKSNAGTIDLLICTINSFKSSSLDDYLSLLKRNGSLVFVGLPPSNQDVKVSFMKLCVN